MTTEQLEDFYTRIQALTADVEEAEGPNAADCYPGRLSMLLHLAYIEARRMREVARKSSPEGIG